MIEILLLVIACSAGFAAGLILGAHNIGVTLGRSLKRAIDEDRLDEDSARQIMNWMRQ